MHGGRVVEYKPAKTSCEKPSVPCKIELSQNSVVRHPKDILVQGSDNNQNVLEREL